MTQAWTINARKHDGTLHRTWQAELIERLNEMLVFEGRFEFHIDHPDIGIIRPGTISLEYYWLNRHFNVFKFLEPEGTLKCFYCNVNLPPTVGTESIDYVDLDLDVIWIPGEPPRTLDLEEFEINSLRFGYSEKTILTAQTALRELLQMIDSSVFPFSEA